MRRPFLFLAFLLIVGVGLFVALVMVPQLQQTKRVQEDIQAGANDPVASTRTTSRQGSASGLLGSWIVNGDVAWDNLRKSPEIAKQLAGLSPKDIERVKFRILIETATITCQFTADKLIYVVNGRRHEDGYAITATNGNVLTAESTDDRGNLSKITVTGDHMEMTESDRPGEVLILTRAP